MNRFVIPAAILFAAGVFFMVIPFVPSITVRVARSGRLAASLPVQKGDIVGLAYIHSANKGAVLDEFQVSGDGSLVLVRSVFQSFGAGMSDGLEPGVSMHLTKKGVELTGLNRKIGTLRMAVGTIANHRLRAAGREIELARRVGVRTFVKIAYQRISLYQAVRERIRNGKE
ncbi:MAG: DUF1850 domain-containing protein [Treponemataceae bacterium]